MASVTPRPAGETAAQLNRDAVVERALAIADDEGLAAVTLRRLAQELGVTPMALYWHVSDKDDLLAAMGDRLFRGLPPDTDPALAWQEQLRDLVLALTTALRSHPNVAALAAPRALQNDEGRCLTEAALALLHTAGFPVAQAAEIARHMLRTAISLVIEQAPNEPSHDPAQRGEDAQLKRLALRGLPPERFPRLVEAADALADCADEDGYYRFGVDLLLAGVTMHAPTSHVRQATGAG